MVGKVRFLNVVVCAGLPPVARRCISHDLQTVNPPKQRCITTEYIDAS